MASEAEIEGVASEYKPAKELNPALSSNRFTRATLCRSSSAICIPSGPTALRPLEPPKPAPVGCGTGVVNVRRKNLAVAGGKVIVF